MNNDTFNIRITVEIGDKEIAQAVARDLTSNAAKTESPETILSAILYTFGATKISEVQYMPHPKENIGAVAMILECSEEQSKKNCEAPQE